ncbi:polyphenol oxidase family protein [Desulfovibrionales bacterium]
MPISFFSFHFPGLKHIHCVFTTRLGGHSTGSHAAANISLEVGDDPQAVQANRDEIRQALGFSQWQELRQVHGQEIYYDLDADFFHGPSLEGDGLCTSRQNCALVIKTADCQALLLTDVEGRHIAALHCGWRGNAGNFPANAVRAFCAHYSVDPARLMVVRGPSLGPGQSEFINFEQEWNPIFRQYYNPISRSVDLWTLTRNQLMGAGIPARNIYSLDLCTASSDQFFSYRRENITGRQAALIWKA